VSRRRLDDDVPRIPRGRGLKLSAGQFVQVVMVAAALVAVVILAKPCGRAVSGFVTGFDRPDGGSAPATAIDAGAATAPTLPDGVILRGDMTPEELEAAIAKARAAAAADPPADAGIDAPAR
jgi:hypothetical protein